MSGEHGVGAVSRQHQEGRLDHASSGVGHLARDGEDCQGGADPKGGRLLRCRKANADLLPDLSRRRAEFRQSCHHRLVREWLAEHDGRRQVAGDVDARQAVRSLVLMAETEDLGQRAAGRHLQQGREMPAGPHPGGMDGDAQGCEIHAVRVRGSPPADVRDSAERTTDEVPLAVGLLDETFRLKHGEGTPQRRCADPVLRGQMRLRRQAFAGLEPTRDDPLPEVIGDGVAS